MYYLVGGLVPESYEGVGEGVWLVDIVVLPMGLHTPSAPYMQLFFFQMNFIGNWVELTRSIATQPQKDKHHIFCLVFSFVVVFLNLSTYVFHMEYPSR